MHVFKASSSSSVDFIVFDGRTRKMFVRYESGPKIYVVEQVDRVDYDSICSANSVGKALSAFLKNQKTSQSGSSTFKLTDDEARRVLAAVDALSPGATSDLERAVSAWQSEVSAWF